jgi:hypothetical protein
MRPSEEILQPKASRRSGEIAALRQEGKAVAAVERQLMSSLEQAIAIQIQAPTLYQQKTCRVRLPLFLIATPVVRTIAIARISATKKTQHLRQALRVSFADCSMRRIANTRLQILVRGVRTGW